MAPDAAAASDGDVAAALEALRSALEGAGCERTSLRSDEGAPANRERDGYGDEAEEYQESEQKPFCEALHQMYLQPVK